MTTSARTARKVSSLYRKTSSAVLMAFAATAFTALDFSSATAQIETVVVTARKREENVQNIPVAVTALSGDKLDKYNMTSLENVAAQTPQLIVQRGGSGSGADISLRGIGSSFENIGIEQSVAVNVDGVYFGQGRVLNDGFFDMKQVEILKGPQALYFGKNATAGAISLESKDPGDTLEAYVRATYEFKAQEPSIEAVVSGPVTDTLGLRLAVRGSEMFGGYFTNNAPGGLNYATRDAVTGDIALHPTDTPERDSPREKTGVVRLTAKWTPDDRFSLNVKATGDVYKTNNNSYNVVPFYCPLGSPQLNPAESCGKQWSYQVNDTPADIAATNPLLNKKGGRNFEEYESYTLIANAQYVMPKYTLSSVSGYQRLYNDWAGDQDFTGTPLVMAGEHFTWHAFSTEERVLTTLDFPVNFSGGLYYQSTQLDFNQDVVFFGSDNTAVTDPTTQYTSYRKLSATAGTTYAAFGQFIWDILPDLQGTLGGRFTHEIKSSFFRQPYVNPGINTAPAGPGSPPPYTLAVPYPFLFLQYDPSNPATQVAGHQDFDNFSPEAMLTWHPTEDMTVYGGWKRGFKSGGFSASAILSTLGSPNDFFFKPEKAQGLEGGVKSTWFDNQLQVNVDVYNYLYTNLQVDFFNTPTFNYITLNAASARTKGIEFEAQYAPKDVSGLTLRGTLAYDDAHYGHFIAPCSPAGISFEEGCNYHRDPITGSIIPAGQLDPTTGSFCDGSAAHACDFMNVSGRPTALAPKWTASFEGDYNTPVGEDLILGLSGNLRFSSSYVANGFPSDLAMQIDRQGAYAMFDASVRIGDTDNHWEVALIGKNLNNEFVIAGAQGLPLSGGSTGLHTTTPAQLLSDQGGVVLDPRTIAIQATYRY